MFCHNRSISVGPFSVEVLAERAGRATLAIAPEEILLAPGPMPSSARNVVRGRVVRIAEQGAAVRVVVDAGVELVALVTRRSYVELGLGPGSEVYAMFKSVAVKVFW